jgi:carbonic anhydrase
MQRLLEGYRRFREERWPREQALWAALANGQTPRMLVIACSDSRVDPATIFDAGPGELFIIRNVANLVPPFKADEGLHGTSAAIEFAVVKLEVRTILVVGHASCGGVTAALSGEPVGGTMFLDQWIGLLAPARARCLACEGGLTQENLEREAIKVSIERLHEFPFVAERVASGAIEVIGARFAIADGGLELLDAVNGGFHTLT